MMGWAQVLHFYVITFKVLHFGVSAAVLLCFHFPIQLSSAYASSWGSLTYVQKGTKKDPAALCQAVSMSLAMAVICHRWQVMVPSCCKSYSSCDIQGLTQTNLQKENLDLQISGCREHLWHLTEVRPDGLTACSSCAVVKKLCHQM